MYVSDAGTNLLIHIHHLTNNVLKIQRLACTLFRKIIFHIICLIYKIHSRETTAQFWTWTNSFWAFKQIIFKNCAVFSNNIIDMTMQYSKIIFFQMNWSTRKKSLKPSLTNLTKPSLKCRVTKPCAVKKTLMQLSSFPHQLGRPQRCLGAWKICLWHLQIILQCANFTNRKVQLNIFYPFLSKFYFQTNWDRLSWC